MSLHSTLTGADLHEPKGVASASANTAYFADGSASGSWRKVTAADLDTSSIQNPNTIYLTTVIPDISTASSILIPVIESCVFNSATLVLGGAIGTADDTISFTRNDGSSFGSNVSVLFTSSAEGDQYSFSATLNTTISANGYIKVTTSGASDNAIPLYVTVKLTRIP